MYQILLTEDKENPKDLTTLAYMSPFIAGFITFSLSVADKHFYETFIDFMIKLNTAICLAPSLIAAGTIYKINSHPKISTHPLIKNAKNCAVVGLPNPCEKNILYPEIRKIYSEWKKELYKQD